MFLLLLSSGCSLLGPPTMFAPPLSGLVTGRTTCLCAQQQGAQQGKRQAPQRDRPQRELPHRPLGVPRPSTHEMLQRLSPLSLAFLGDAVWEQAAREHLMWPPSKMNELSTRVQALACAEGQYTVLTHLVDGFGLSDDELDWVRRGRNGSSRGPRRLDVKVYRASTGFETLVGVLHLSAPTRLAEMLDFLFSSAFLNELSLEPPPAESEDG